MVNTMGKHKEIKVNGVTQRFVWIEPGSFLMGSPEDEAGRYDDEAQHEVTLTKGFWLADTACTQGLWQAVMGKNPSRFRNGARRPVETVSWDDAQLFISTLNQLIPDLHARFPTEAEWEYACRAGTTTPFSFGDELTPNLVNYDGEIPYADGARGLYRMKTVAVASLPANAWGLYEMHGNIWEWCADRYGDYANEPQVDPQGPPSSSDLRMLRGAPAGMHPTWPFGGDSRVLRGGSWGSSGRNVRSASRYWAWPGNRSLLVGFRIAADGEKR